MFRLYGNAEGMYIHDYPFLSGLGRGICVKNVSLIGWASPAYFWVNVYAARTNSIIRHSKAAISQQGLIPSFTMKYPSRALLAINRFLSYTGLFTFSEMSFSSLFR